MAGYLFTGTSSGDLKSIENRERLARQASVSLQFMVQTHSDIVAIVDQSTSEAVGSAHIQADAMVTAAKGIGLAVLAADCLPIVLTSNEAVAVIHAGRIGVASEIISKTVLTMRDLGASTIAAVIGPAICGSCYEVSAEMYEQYVLGRPSAGTNSQLHCLDLKAAARVLLQDAGVSVTDLEICTLEDSRYFSYRKDATAMRNAGVVWL